MDIRTWFIFILNVGALTCELKSNCDHRLSESLILNHCEKGNETLVVYDDSKQLDVMWLQQLHEQFHSVILYKKSSPYQENYFNVKKIDVILITVTSWEKLSGVFDNIHSATWWNVLIPVYVLNLPNNSCESANEALWNAWTNKVLTGYFLCAKDHEVYIYTYNPFTNRAPSDWREVQRSPVEPRWTLYQQKHRPAMMCQGLEFDRTKHLDGYNIRVDNTNAMTSYARKHLLKSHRFVFDRTSSLKEWLAKFLNVTTKIDSSMYLTKDKTNCQTYKTAKGILLEQNKTDEKLYDLVVGDHDIQKGFDVSTCVYTLAYPLGWYENGFAVKHRGYRTLYEKFWNFCGIWTILFTIFILMLTFSIIWSTSNGNVAFATFEIIRLLVSQSLHTPMKTLYLRLFFISVLIYFLIIHTSLDGHLADFLSKPERNRLPEKHEDLKDLGYIHYQYRPSFEDTFTTVMRFGLFSDKSCIRNVSDYVTVCIYDHATLIRWGELFWESIRRAISTNPIETQYTSFAIKKHWPLFKKVNRVLISFEDFGLRKFMSEVETKQKEISLWKRVDLGDSSEFTARPIKLEHLEFCFWILAVGLGSAICSFCVEIFIGHKERLLNLMEDIKTRSLRTLRRINIRCKFRR